MSVFVVAEAGVNHGGNFETALELCQAAKDSMADAVKFQLFESRKLWGDDRIAHLEMSMVRMKEIRAYCNAIGIEFMCSPFGLEELLWLKPLVKRMKIPSGLLTNHEMLQACGDMPVLLSTGMSTTDEISQALYRLDGEVTLLQCTSSYPCRVEDVNLLAMPWMGGVFGKPYGLSDHTSGITTAIAAVALGATVIEKHLTLDRNIDGPDQSSSITPKEFKAMCMAIYDVELALGSPEKRVMRSEEELRRLWREKH